jgi:RNA polymerase subunit RPABC4/transcription elongation factor Spt4
MTKEYIKKHLLDKNGKFKARELSKFTDSEKQSLWNILHDDTNICHVCGDEKKFINNNKGYLIIEDQYCSKKCYFKNAELTKTMIETYLIITRKDTGDISLNSNHLKLFPYSTEALYLFYHDIKSTDVPLCHCGEPRKFNSFKSGYYSTCGDKHCIDNSPERISKMISHKPKDIGKRISTGLKNRTTEQIQESTSKSKQTRLSKYNNENYVNSEKAKKTSILRYGSTSYFNSKEGKEKSRSTKKQKYCNENYNNPEKTKETRAMRKAQGKQYTHNPIKNTEFLNKEYIIQNFIENDYLLKEEFMEFYECKETFMYRTLKKLGIKYKSRKSYQEFYISELIPGSTTGDRSFIKPLEIDILSHEHKLCIEYDGLLAHSYGYSKFDIFSTTEEKPKEHLSKTELCESEDYTLYRIFENEWIDPVKKEIWISKIRGKQGSHEKIHARKCSIKEISTEQANAFLVQNHLQGYANASVKIGLFHETELVSVCTFGKTRFSKQYEWELIRLASKKNITVVGGAGKLLKYFERHYDPESLVSYANRRWSSGNVYEKLGFIFSHNSAPNYFYFKEGSTDLQSRNKFQKHKLKNLLELYDENLSETENMYLNNYRKIYDCGNKVYFKQYNE